MSGLLSRLRARIRREDAYVHAVEDAPKGDFIERWDHLRLARRRILVPSLFGAVGVAGLATEAQAQVTTPFLSWPFKSTGGISKRINPDRPFDAGISVLEFYPALNAAGAPFTVTPFVTVAKTTTVPLTTCYTADAPGVSKATTDYPFLTGYGLTAGNMSGFELDWCAIMAAFLYGYNRDSGSGVARILFPVGHYAINRTLLCCLKSPVLIGEGTASGATQIRYTSAGANGTLQQPIPMLQFQATTELGIPQIQPGSSFTQQAGTNGGSGTVQGLLFGGKYGTIGGVPSDSNFITGIRIGPGGNYTVRNCFFDGNLWDGIQVTGYTTQIYIEYNNFNSIFRDAIAICPTLSNFSTTMYIQKNSFNLFGRYAILINAQGIGVYPFISGNVVEGGTVPSYFLANPQWYYHGIPAVVCIGGSTQAHIDTTYLELSVKNLGFLHLAGSPLGEFFNNSGSGHSPMTVASTNIGTVSNSACTWSGTNMTASGTQSGTFYPGMGVLGTVATYSAGNVVAGLSTITGLPSTTGLTPGLAVFTPGYPGVTAAFPAGTTVVTIDSSSQITCSNPSILTKSFSSSSQFTIGVPGGARIVGGSAPNWVMDTSLTISTPIALTVTTRTPSMIAYTNTYGYGDLTNTQNYWCGSTTNALAQSSVGASKFSGLGNLFTVGGITFNAGQNEIDNSTVSVSLDFPVNDANGCVALAVCSAGVVDLTAGVLTVDISGNSSVVPFAVGQTVFGFGLGSNTAPSDSFVKTYTDIVPGGTGSGGQGTYNLSGTTALGATAAQIIYAMTMTAKRIADFGTFSGVANSLYEAPSITGAANPYLAASYGRWHTMLEARLGSDSTAELLFQNSIAMRYGIAANVDGSSTTHYNSYTGFFMNTYPLANLTLTYTSIADLPMWYADMRDGSGTQTAYYEFAGCVLTKRKIRYNFTASPASGTWNTGDIAYNASPISGGFIGWVCTAGGSPGTWKTFGVIS